MEDLPQRIRHWRTTAGLSVEGLARAVGVSHGAVWQWENRDVAPTVANLAKIAAACGVELRTFFGVVIETAAAE